MYISQLWDGCWHTSCRTNFELSPAEFDLVYRGPRYASRADAQAAVDALKGA